MSETKHTQGPLTISGPSPGGRENDDGGDYAIRDGYGFVIGEAIHIIAYYRRVAPAKANAQLWATADELLVVLEAAMDYIDKSPCDYDIRFDQLAAWERLQAMSPKAVIAKARGEVT